MKTHQLLILRKRLPSTALILLVFSILTLTACKKDPVCVSSDLKLKETKVVDVPDSSLVKLYFDVTNNSGQDYNEADTLISIVRTKILVVTKDGEIYETVDYLPFNYLSQGATRSMRLTATYGEGKEYESYSISLFCE